MTLIAEGLGRGRFVSFCAKTFLHFALKSCYVLGQKLMLIRVNVKLTTPENSITFHNAPCLSPQNFAY